MHSGIICEQKEKKEREKREDLIYMIIQIPQLIQVIRFLSGSLEEVYVLLRSTTL